MSLYRYEALDATGRSVRGTTDAGTPVEQTKCKIADPSGNVIEFKTYADPVSAFAAD